MFTDFETYKNYETVLTTIGDSSHENNSIEIDYDDRFVQLPEAYDIFQNIYSNHDVQETVRQYQLRKYIHKHNLPFKYYQDFGWQAVEL